MGNSQNEKKLIFFIADGWRKDILDRLVAGGDLPVIKEIFYENGFVADHMITTFPPVSIATHTSMLTGHDCFRHQINSIRYLNRETNRSKSYIGLGTLSINRDLSPHSKTLYEYFGGESDAIFEPMNRGATRSTKTRSYKSTTALKILRKRIVNGRLKKGTVVWLPSLDIIGHRFGSESSQVVQEMKLIDNDLGATLKLLKANNQFENTYIFFASDHGQRNVIKHFDLRKYFSDQGYRVLGKFYQRLWSKYIPYDVTVWSSGHGSAHIYLGNGNNRPELDAITDSLLKNNSVQLVCQRVSNGNLMVHSSRGCAKISVKSSSDNRFANYEFKYSVMSGKDPVNFHESPAHELINSGFHSGETWFKKTIKTDYPDFMVQLSQALLSPNAGDLIVTASDGWDFRDSWHKACHGSWYKEDMDVPLMIAGPEIKQDSLSVRTVDLLPTIIELFGMKPDYFDGRSFANEIMITQPQQLETKDQLQYRQLSTALCG